MRLRHDRNARNSWARCLAALVCLLGLALNAQAQITAAGPSIAAIRNGYTVSYASNGTPIAQAARSFATGATSGEAVIRDMFTARGAAGEAMSMVASRTAASSVMGPLAVAAAIAGAYQVGSAVKAAFDAANARMYSSATGFEINSGATYSVTKVYKISAYSQSLYASASAACTAGASAAFQSDYNSYTAQGKTFVAGNISSTETTCTRTWTLNGTGYTTTVPITSGVDSWCVDSNGLAVVRPTGGTCPAGTYSPATAEQVQAAIQAKVGQINAPGIVQEALAKGVPVPGPTPVTVTGPATAPARTTTTVGPAGTTTTTINNTYNYAGDTVTWDQTTTVAGPNGTTTTTETKPEDQRAECEKAPDTVGCMRLGDPPTDQVPKANRDLTYTAESVSLPSACPAPITFVVGGVTRTISYDNACDTATSMSPYVKALGAMTALLMVVTALRTT